jgi:hypothetical protein
MNQSFGNGGGIFPKNTMAIFVEKLPQDPPKKESAEREFGQKNPKNRLNNSAAKKTGPPKRSAAWFPRKQNSLTREF